MPVLGLSDDSDSDGQSPRSAPLTAAERLAIIEQRTKEMTSALSSRAMDDIEADLSKKLDLIEQQREELERQHQEEEEAYRRKAEQGLTVEHGQFTYRNEHFRDLSKRDEKDKISSTFIFDGKSMKGDGDGNLASGRSKRPDDMFTVDPEDIDRTRHIAG